MRVQASRSSPARGALATFEGRTGHGGLGGVLGGCWLGCGRLWVGSGASRAVGVMQEEDGLGGGPGRSSLRSSSSHGSGRGVEQTRTVKLTVARICSIFICRVFDEMLARSLNLNF
jgi:hypothetical protein